MEPVSKILIVEDNAIVAADIQARVQKFGYLVTDCVTSGEDALVSVQKVRPDLILMDIRIKGAMSGIEAAAKIRSSADIPIVYLTSFSDEKTLEQAKETDPYGYIVKPFDEKELQITIEISLRKHQVENQLRENEQWLKTTLASMGNGVITADTKGLLTFMNPVAEQLTGLSLPEVVGRPVTDLFQFVDESSQELVENPIMKVLETGVVVEGGNHTLLQIEAGRKIPVKYNSSSILLDKSLKLGVVFAFQDITEELRLQRLLKEQETAVRQHQKLEAIGTLAGGIAHDFNNILAAIIGFTELSLDEVAEGSILHDNLEEVYSASLRAKDLVNQILTFSKEGGEEKEVVDICPLIADAVTMLRSTIPASIELIKSWGEEAFYVEANPSQLSQVLINLVANSVSAIDTSGTIWVGLERKHLDDGDTLADGTAVKGDFVVARVRDTGRGISKEHINSIFDPYFSTKPPEKGSGLGLSVVHGIVKSHEGFIDVRSDIGLGTEVAVYLPVARQDVQAADIPVKDHLRAGTERLLVVDDDPKIASLHKKNLERFGYTVTAVVSSSKALNRFLLQQQEFDMVITDMTMPVMSGLELAGEIKSRRPELPVLICTGFSEKISHNNQLPAQVDALLMKPVQNAQLLEKVRYLLDAKKAPQA